MRSFAGSHIQLLTHVYPDYNWQLWKFSRCPKSFWEDVKNQRNFMDWIAQQKNFTSMDDWYKLTYNDLKSMGGGTLLIKYNSSVIQLLMGVYPEFDWKRQQFPKQSHNHWDNIDNQKAFLEMAKEKLNVKTMSDWYNVTLLVIMLAFLVVNF